MRNVDTSCFVTALMKRLVKRILRSIAPKTFSVMQAIRSRRLIERQCRIDGRAELGCVIGKAVNGRVQEGLFEGMLLDPDLFPQHMSPKLLGTYEDEVHPFLGGFRGVPFGAIVNIGCAEGYYVVGSARLWPSAQVTAFDLDPLARRVTSTHVSINGVADRVEIRGRATSSRLSRLLRDDVPSLLISDCEGAELELIDPEAIPRLEHSHVLVEMHPDAVPEVETVLRDRLSGSHHVEVVQPVPKTPDRYAGRSWLKHVPPSDQKRALNEYRGYTPWLAARPMEVGGS